jgi:hypothetical protein
MYKIYNKLYLKKLWNKANMNTGGPYLIKKKVLRTKTVHFNLQGFISCEHTFSGLTQDSYFPLELSIQIFISFGVKPTRLI